jgi:hypothetical protein
MRRDSNDVKARGTRVNTESGRKWSVHGTVEEAESRLRHNDIVGSVTVGRQGLGVTSMKRWWDAEDSGDTSSPCGEHYGSSVSLVQIDDNSLDIWEGKLKWPLCGYGGRETNIGKRNTCDISCVQIFQVCCRH